MSSVEDALDPLILRDVEVHAFAWIGIVAKDRYDRVGFVQYD